jgi:putative FmdB family regulatory protein
LPFFDFRCESCGHRFTVLISNAEKQNQRCPECGSQTLKQVLGSFGFAVKDSTAPSCRESCPRGDKCFG